MKKWIAIAALLALAAGSASAQDKGAPAPGKGAAPTPAPSAAPEQMPKPKVGSVQVVLKDAAGKELKRLSASTTGKDTDVICAYAAKEPSPDTLALAFGVKDNWQLQAEFKNATKKMTADGVSLTLADGGKTALTTWTGGPDACTVSKGTFDGKNADISMSCKNVGGELGAGRTLEAQVHVEGCPSL
jgi:hypothetical protein